MKSNSNNICIENCRPLLKVFESQLNAAEREMMNPSKSLSVAFEGLFSGVNELLDIESSEDNIDQGEASYLKTRMNELIQTCVIELQFADAVSQRILHVSYGMGKLEEVLGDSDSCNSSEKWSMLKNQIRKSYSIEDERNIFDQFINSSAPEYDLAESSEEDVDIF